MHTAFASRPFVPLAAVMLLALASTARGQEIDEVPPPDAEAASVDDFRPVARQVKEHGAAAGHAYAFAGDDIYYSPTLRGHFRAQWMFIRQGGRKITFWGARIIGLDFDSPLRQIGLAPGDVVTRLDGISVARRMVRVDGGPWQLVQMERHFGRTEVRYIHPGTNRVNVGDIMLDGNFPPDADTIPIPP
jgi:hypothetical protein